MITLILNSFLVVLLFSPFGLLLSNKSKNNLEYYTSQLLYGVIIISFIALLLNFFFPLKPTLNTMVLLIPLYIIFKNFKLYFNKNFLIFLLLSCTLITLLITESNVYRPDAGLYHLPYIKILNEEKIIFGLSNLHFRYGHISIIQYLSAISNNLIFIENGIVFAQALIASSVIINFCFKIYNYHKNENYNFHFYYLIAVFIFIIYKMNRYSEYGNDAPAHFLLFFLISEILILKENGAKNICNNFILIAFVIFNKITLLVCFFLGLIFLTKKNIIEILKLKRFYFLIFFTFFWLIKNVIISGCILYPVKSLCYENFLWSNIEQVGHVSVENEAWTKGWPDYSKIQNKNIKKEISIEDYSKNFFWIKYWSTGHLSKITRTLTPYILFLLTLVIFIKTYSKIRNKFSINKKYLYLILIMFVGTLLWFFKVPVFRYGYSYLISLISLLFAYTCIHFSEVKTSIKKLFSYLLIFCIFILTTKNILRIVKTENDYNNYPWPKYYSMDDKNEKVSTINLILNNVNFSKPKEGEYCMYSDTICTHYGLDKNLKLTKKKNYLVLFKDKK